MQLRPNQTPETLWPPLPDRTYWEVLVFLVLAALFLAGGLMGHSVWYDEALSEIISSKPSLLGVAEASLQVKPYPPLFYLLQHISLQFVGGEMGLRIPAAMAGALAMVGIYLLGWELSGRLTGLVAAGLFWLTPGAFRYFVDGNAYSLLMAIAALSTWRLLLACRVSTLRNWLVYAFLAILLLMTHVLAFFTVASQVLAALWLLRERLREDPRIRRSVFAGVATLAAGWLAFLVVYFTIGTDIRPLRLDLLLDWRVAVAVAGVYLGPLSFGSVTQFALWLLLQALGVLALYRRDPSLLVFLMVIAAGTVLGSTLFVRATVDYIAYKYGIASFPIACLLAVQAIPSVVGNRGLRVLLGAVLLVYAGAGASVYFRGNESLFEFQNWRAAAAHVRQHATSDDGYVFLGSSDLVPFRYYWRDLPDPQVAYDGPGVKTTMETQLDRHPRVWLMAGNFENPNPLAQSVSWFYTSTRRTEMELAKATLATAGYSFCEEARFLRVEVVVVQRAPCAVPTP